MLREWLASRASAVYAAARGLLEAVERLHATVRGRELAEMLRRPGMAQMLLGGFDPEAENPYRAGSLCRLYRGLYGVQVLSPRLLALRLRDGVPLELAGRGVIVEAEETRFLRMVSAVAVAAEGLLERLGAEKPRPRSYDTSDPSWGLEAATSLAREVLRLLPPYSREAMIASAASAPAPLGIVARLAGEEWGSVLDELRGLGLVEALRLPGAEQPPPRGLDRVLARPGPVLEAYRCLALAALSLLQLDELRLHVEAPDPLRDALREAGSFSPLASRLAVLGEKLPALPAPEGCPSEPPRPPRGYVVARGELVLRDVEVLLPSGEALGTYMDALEALAPLIYVGLAGLGPTPREGGLSYWLVAPTEALSQA